jgi:hypothetical protein
MKYEKVRYDSMKDVAAVCYAYYRLDHGSLPRFPEGVTGGSFSRTPTNYYAP